MNFLLSIIIPAYNEAHNIKPLIERLFPVVKDYNHEVIFIDDGSKDESVKFIKKIAKENHKVKLIAFLRNFGHQMALSAGYEKAKGNCVVSLDADLQDPPEIIHEMVKKWQTGAKIVYARRGKREVDGLIKRTTASLFYRFINFLSDTPIPEEVGDFRLLDRQVVDFLKLLPERSRFLRGLVAWAGFPEDYVYFTREKRLSGRTHYSLSKMVNFALEGIISFSIRPLRMASYLGFSAATIGFIGIIYAIIGKFFRPSFFPHDWVTGWTGLFVGIMFLGGIQLITIGIIGEYVGKIYQELQRRPRYLIKEEINL